MLRAVLLAALNVPDARIVAHGIDWRDSVAQQVIKSVNGRHELIASDAPHLKSATAVITQCLPKMIRPMTAKFFAGDPVLEENLHLLQVGESVVLNDSDVTFTALRIGERVK